VKSKDCPRCRALLVQATTVCSRCGYTFEDVAQPIVPAPTWLPPENLVPPEDRTGTPPPPRGEGAAADPGRVEDPWGPPRTDSGPGAGAGPGGAPYAEPTAAGGYGAPGYGAPGHAVPGYGAGYGYAVQQNHPRATTAMVLGILGLVLCGVLGIPAVVIGNGVLRDIRASPGQYAGEGSARAGVIMGWIAIGLLVLGVVAIIALVMLGSTTEPRFSQIGPPVTEF
jgi:hypothetical protein